MQAFTKALAGFSRLTSHFTPAMTILVMTQDLISSWSLVVVLFDIREVTRFEDSSVPERE